MGVGETPYLTPEGQMASFPTNPVRLSKMVKNGSVLGYGDHRVSVGTEAVMVHYANGDTVTVADVEAARWAITLEVWTAQQ